MNTALTFTNVRSDLITIIDKPELERHAKKCLVRTPPGDEIYRHENVSVFEVDGATQEIYCQNLCYLSKLFLDHKNLELDTTAYHFYVSCEYEPDGYRMFGYFSKEKSFSVKWDNEADLQKRNVRNLSCIFVLPFY